MLLRSHAFQLYFLWIASLSHIIRESYSPPLSKNVTNNIELASRVTAPEPAQHDVIMMLPSCCCLLAAANYEAYYSAIAITHHHT